MAKTILITHQKGGVGKSTLTLNLALNLYVNCKVAILDMDLQGSLSRLSTSVKEIHITNDISILEQSDNYDIIFIDTPPYLSNDLPTLIRRVDLIILPTKAGILDVLSMENTLEIIRMENKQSVTLITLNMVKPNTTLTEDILSIIKPFKIKVANTRISNLVAFTRSVVLKGVRKDQKAQGQIDSLTQEILTLLIK